MLALAVTLAALGLTACDPTGDVRFLDTPIATHRVDGVGWAVSLTPSRIYLGGTFTTVRNQSGQSQGAYANLAAFDRTTGAVIPGFRADTNGIVRTVAVWGDTLFLGGDFTTVNGQPRARLAAVDLQTGAVKAFRADTNRVNKVVVAGDRLYVAGAFTTIGGVPRNRVAALDLTTGAVDPTFDPDVNAMVNTIAARPDRSRVFIGGLYSNVHGTATTRLTALDGFTGAVVGPTFLDVSGEALDLELNKDGTRLAAALAEYGNQGALFNTTTGSKMFRQRCGGDAQAVAIAGDNWYTGYHEECEGDFTIRLVGNSMLTGARQTDWLPAFDRFWGVRDLATDGRVLVVAGDFTSVAGVPAQGFTIFPAAPPPAPPPVSLPANATWRYLDSGVLEPGWSDPTFDDTTWAQGPAQLGYGDGDEATVISYGPNANQKYVTSWFRTSFLATAVPATLTLDLVADDGAVVYLNGVEVLRDNVGPGDDVAALRAASGRSGTAENAVRSFVLPPELVTAGINTIAVSVHQDLPTSSDLSFSAALRSTAAG
ncbi:MAG TPA: hypothetical protein PK748_12825 [Acidimicrobiales bacterium]|nr:hypothetical protein [Acidimicrobiales bacterium]